MTVKELSELLEKVKDKSLPIRVLEYNPDNPEFNMANYWLYDVEVVDIGSSGYENSGEVILIGGE
jgi:hypothetical protein|tara:strand:+ start:42 stop:236 length:195 start_codon:yes stop_codon:yes gene_type:complete